MIKYGEWLPDASDLMNGGSIEVKNVIPSSRGISRFVVCSLFLVRQTNT